MSKTIIEPKILKGTRDFLPNEMAKRNYVMSQITRIFQKYGYDTIETPIINYAETILGKYGDDGDRLTYNFDDSGGRRIALPYDLTVPFARLVAANWQDLPMPFKRYQIQRVWRAEKPQKGRLREFYQCDIDVIGTKSLVAEAEIARVIVDVFVTLGFENFKIKVNSRRLMNAILESLGFSEEPMAIIRVIDKMDKIGEDGVRAELATLGVSEDKIEGLFKAFSDGVSVSQKRLSVEAREPLSLSLADGDFSNYDMSEMDEFMRLCREFGIGDYVEFDPCLARGLDYYTGIIYEVISDDLDFGTLCAGGRYDDLCGLFCKEDFSGVGVAFGFERIMLALEGMGKLSDVSLNSQVLVTLFDEKSVGDSIKLYKNLVDAGINAEIYFEPAKLSKQFKYASKKSIKFVVIRGPEESEKGEVTVKFMDTGQQKAIPVNQLISYIKGYV